MSKMNLHQSQSHEVLRSWQSQRTDVNHHKDFVLPLFVGNDDNSIEAIESMPGVYRYGSNRAIEYLEPLVNSYGLRAILLFPVVTKNDQAKIENDDSSVAGETNSSGSSGAQSSSSSTDDDDDDDDKRTGPISVMPERLIPEDESAEQHSSSSSAAANFQNPFLNQNEEEEDHLLVEEDMNDRLVNKLAQQSGDKAQRQLDGVSIMRKALKKASLMSDGNKRSLDKTRAATATKSRDVRLIRGLALKDENNPVLRLIPRLRAKFPELLIICDVCLCTFTSTGHCCLFEQAPTHSRCTSKSLLSPATLLGTSTSMTTTSGPPIPINPQTMHYPISNMITCQYLALLALEYARRGCNVVAPSDMMDGRIQTIREKLNENHLHHVSILSYSAKFASAFYGPFRQATMNAPEFGDRRAYQLPPGSRALALKAVQRDIEQGADFVMVKPGGPYLDIVRDLREAHPNVPIAVYQVSGEYSMLKIAANANIIDLKVALNEMLTAYRRAGATIIISYFTPEILRGEL